MSAADGPQAGVAGDAAARERLERLFTSFDRLTPDELAHLGYRMAGDEEREPLLVALDEAAQRTGRVALVDAARSRARDAVMRRYADGLFRPTFAGLNWGVSGGTVEDRVAIAETLADAAAAAVLEDALDPEVGAALALDAESLVGLAAGTVSEGSIAHAIGRSADPDLGPSPAAHLARVVAAAMAVFVGLVWLAGAALGPIGVAAAVVAGVGVLVVGTRRRG